MEVYLVTCKTNGKQYVGKTKHSTEGRWKLHLKHARGGSPMLLQRAIRKHGEENFTVVKIAECETAEELNQLEIEKIAELNTRIPFGYNVTKGGDGGCGHQPGETHPMYGKKHSEETIEQMSLSHLGKHAEDTHREDCQCWVCRTKDQDGEKNPMYGKKCNENQSRAASINAKATGLANKGKPSPQRGVKRSEEVRQRILFAQRLRRVNERIVKSIAEGDYRA